MSVSPNLATVFSTTYNLTTVDRVEDATFSAIPPVSGNLEIYALPIGQGDCTIIQCPSGSLVVLDCGSSSANGPQFSALQVRNYLGSRINDVSTIIITHPDRDHYNYLFQIGFNVASIQNVIIGANLSSYVGTHQDNLRIVAWLANFQRMMKLQLVSGGNGCIGNCVVNSGTNFCNNANIQFTILAANVGNTPNELWWESAIFNSLLCCLETWKDQLPLWLQHIWVSRCSRLCTRYIAHHGASRLANKQDWLAPIQPTMAFASSAYNFGNCRHPHCDAICNLMPLGLTTINSDASLSHAFYCGNNPGNPIQRNDYPYSIYQTTPAANIMCLLTYTSALHFSHTCYQVQEVSVSTSVGDDECPQEIEKSCTIEEQSSGTQNMIVSIVPFMSFSILTVYCSLLIL